MKRGSLLLGLALLARPADAARLRTQEWPSWLSWIWKTEDVNSTTASDATIRKPVTDRRNYVHTTFDSGLRVLLVQDPDAKTSAFSVAVETGSLDNPPDFQGLAHFTEHMVFLGSEKYPDPGMFDDTMAVYGGTNNAYTSADRTVYTGEIGNEGLEKALDIFAQFFIAPRFAEDMVYKEINAVDSEHKKNMPDIQQRMYRLLQSKANPKNPMSRFFTGNLETLKTTPEKAGKPLPEALHKFFAENYCSRRMHLVMVSNLTFQEQLDLAHKSFDALPATTETSCPPRPTYTQEPLYGAELKNIGRVYTMKTSGSPELWLLFPMEDMGKLYKERAELYIFNALSNYEQGGLKSLLKREDLSLSFSYSMDVTPAGSTMIITFSLTEKGSKNVGQLLQHFYAYVNAVRDAGVDMGLVTDMQQMRQVSFDYQEKASSSYQTVVALSGNLPDVAPEDVLTGGYLIDRPDKELMEKILRAIMPQNMNVALALPDFDESGSNSHEVYYDFAYHDGPIETELPELGVTDKELVLADPAKFGLVAPPRLQYVPRALGLVSDAAVLGPGSGPERIFRQGGLELWWLGRGRFELPKASIYMQLGFPAEVTTTAHQSVLASLHSRLIGMALEEPSDALQSCGLGYSASVGRDGISVSFAGFDEHMLKLVELVLPKVLNPGNVEADFENARKQMVLDLADVVSIEPYSHAMEAFKMVTEKGHHSRAELLAAASDTTLVNPAAYAALLKQIFQQLTLQVMVAGNIDRKRAVEIASRAAELLSVQTTSEAKIWYQTRDQVLKPRQQIEVRVSNPIPKDLNSATIAVYQFGVPTMADRVKMSILGEFIYRPVFEILRTQHQLGYVVQGFAAPHGSILELRVIVQGFREAPDVVEGLIESTVQNITKMIEQMSDAEFEQRREAHRTALTQPDATLDQMAGRYWGHIILGTNCFQWNAMRLNYLNSEKFTKQGLLEEWKKTVEPDADAAEPAAGPIPAGSRLTAVKESRRKRIVVKLAGDNALDKLAKYLGEGVSTSDKVIEQVDSDDLAVSLSGEEYWPETYVCQ